MPYSSSYLHIRMALLAAIGVAGCGRQPVDGGDTSDTSDGSASTQASSSSESASTTDPTDTDTATTDVPECEVCDGFEPVYQNDIYTGFHSCPDGTLHRHDLGACDPTVNTAPACNGTEGILNCESDADCTAAPNGKCVSQFGFKGEDSCSCQYSCETDADCDAGEACICTGLDEPQHQRAVCLSVHCLTGDDCASGECGLANYDDGCGPVVTLQCRADDDACRVDGDCEANPSGEFCAIPYGSPEWQCVTWDCAAGRPYTVDGQARTAPLVASSDWQAEDTLESPLPSPDEARALAQFWSRLAAFEHASVASFNRFALQLLAMGAPPELLAQTQRAAADEVRHAQLAFALASHYAGQAIGPGPLTLDAQLEHDPRVILRGLIEEGCVGETLGAIEAETAAAGCRDVRVRAILEEIAADELRHAQLAWSSLRWMLETADEAMREEARRCFADALAAEAQKTSQGTHLPEHGVLSGPARDRVVRSALAEVLHPMVDALAAEGLV